MRPFGLFLLALIGVGCGAVDPGEAPTGIIVATSIPPHAWLIERIGGDAVEVHTVLRPGESPTTHQPSDLQVSRVLSGRVFFRSGVPFESGAWFRALEGHLEIVDLRDGVATRTMATHSHGGHVADATDHHQEGAVDPHIWLSPKRLVSQANHVAEALKRLDPAHQAEYDLRLSELTTELGELDAWIETTLAPFRDRAFVVFHPSWGYFADDYGLRQIAIETEGKEPSDSELTGIQEQTKSLGASVIFVQPQIAGKSAEAIAGVMGARLETLDPLAPDIIDNLRRVTGAIVGSFDD
jgi:zinc transport system substrate-binding protein